MPKSKRSLVQSPRPGSSVTLIATPSERGPRGLLVVYSATVFLSAFLLFQVQPLIGKYILPWFGGTPGVWTTCMLVFQVLLFGGYLYAHLTSRWLGPRAQAGLHVAILAVACLALPIIPGEALKPTGSEQPIAAIVLLLGLTVGLPFFALSATGPLLQDWQSRTHPGRTPYRLYALSNAASLLALISFPAVFEWLFATPFLARIWSWSFAVFAILCAISAVAMASRRRTLAAEPVKSVRRDVPPTSWGTRLQWFALAIIPSTLLLATTNQVCMDVASVPFLWVLPLTLYLLSFILCFESERWYSRAYVMPATVAALAWTAFWLLGPSNDTALWVQVSGFFSAFFLCAMVCHGELFARRPHPEYLTGYYLVISAGGAAGGIFVAIVAPLIFPGYYELHLGLFACVVLMLFVVFTDPKSRFARGRPSWAWLCFLGGAGLFAALLLDRAQDAGGYGIAGERATSTPVAQSELLSRERTFYGILRVRALEINYKDQIRPAQVLLNGQTAHGFEYTDPELWSIPTSYFDEVSGVGRVLSQAQVDKPRRVGIVGLGIGTLAAYARQGDAFKFYEINEHVERIARTQFHFLERCRGRVEVVHGDARLSLEREPEPQNFDVLVLDAFTSDAIPLHLLTREAFALYLRHLAPDGVLAVHISSLHFNLRPVVEAAGDAHRLSMVTIQSEVTNYGGLGSVWELLSRNNDVLRTPRLKQGAVAPITRRVLWTDDHASLLRAWLDR
jgi:protein-L-isoaspartate O-methyltransferase